jgi:hypothetical protein
MNYFFDTAGSHSVSVIAAAAQSESGIIFDNLEIEDLY